MTNEELAVVGKPLPRVDAWEKVTGRAVFTVDVAPPRLLHGKILRSPHPHARIRGIDTTRAEQLPGVKLVLTGRDTGHIRYAFVDTPRYPADETPLATDRVRYVGDEVAAVVAVDEDTAQAALDLIEVDYELLPAVFDPEEAMKPGAPLIHDPDEQAGGGSAWEDWGAKRTTRSVASFEYPNLSGRTSVHIGDVEEGFRQADHIRTDRFRCEATAHCAMEPHAAVARWENGKLDVWLSSMGIFYKRFVLAKVLDVPLNAVRIHKTYVGGAFGGKLDVFPYEILAGLAAKRLGRPVRFELTREECFTTTRQRHPIIVELTTGVKRDGTIVAQDFKVIADNGGYRGTGAVVIFLCYSYNIPLYRVPNYRYEGFAVYTNNPIRGPQRGHGAPQIRFAVDSQLDMIARDLDLDVAEVMLKNAREKGDVIPNLGDRLDTCGLKDAIRSATAASHWIAKRDHPGTGRKRRGIGISVCSMFSGANYYPFASAAIVKMHDDGGATLFTGATEMGQGCDTTLSQVAAEELGIPLAEVRLVSGDTELCPIDLGSFLSGGATVTGSAVRAAARNAKEQILAVASEMLEAPVEDLVVRDKTVYVKGVPGRGVSYGQVIIESIKKRHGDQIVGNGSRKGCEASENYPSLAKAKGNWTDAYGFSCQVAEVEVDTVTGEVRLERVTTYHDCGKPLNQQIVEGQIEGCVSMGQGQALSEEIVLEKGKLFNPGFLGYKLPLAPETPEIVDGIIETLDPHGPFGAKEVGEGAVASVLPAVANAVFDAVGVRIKHLPITPEKVLAALAAQRRAASPRVS